MKKILALLWLAALPTMAQEIPAKTATLNWYKIGGGFGQDHAWQFGLDTGLTAGACLQREVHDGQWLAGPCRDIFILAKNQQPRAHLGAAVMYNAEHGNATYSVRAGVNVGPAVKAALGLLVDRLPYLESLASFKAPPFLEYLGDITTADYAAGYRPVHNQDVIGNWTHGPMFKLDFPLEDVYKLLRLGL